MDTSGVGVLDKAALVLTALESGPATLAGLVAGTGLARPTAHRLAVALEHHRLVARDMQGRFVLGPRLAELSAAAGEDRLLAAAGPVLALAAPQLGGLAGDVAQPREHRPGGGEQPVLAGRGGQLGEPGTEHEPALHVPGHQSVVLERDGQAVRRGPGESGARDQSGEGGRSRLEGGEHEGGLVQHAHSAGVHIAILPSQIMGRKVYHPAHGKDARGEGLGRARGALGTR